jgi:steroid delta-isomerase-like uncharacterized protein
MTSTTTIPVDRATMDRVVDEHYAAEAAGDVPAALRTLTDDVVHDVIGDPAGILHGPDAVGVRYTHLFDNVHVEHVERIRRLYGDDFMIDDKMWTARAVGEFLGVPGNGQLFTTRVTHIFEFRDGRICGETVWLDGGSAIAQLTGAQLTGAQLTGAQLTGAKLRPAPSSNSPG